MRWRAWLLLGAWLAAPALADDAAALLGRLHEPAVLRGDFVQSRQIAGFRQPVESSGHFVVARGTGLLWHTTRPFESLLSATGERLRVSNGEGQPEMTLDARREPMLRTISGLLQSVVAADIAALEAQFDVQVRLVGDAGWELALQPRETMLRERFPSMELAGAAHVATVVLREHGGDTTTIRFSAQVEDTQLSAAEAQQLQ